MSAAIKANPVADRGTQAHTQKNDVPSTDTADGVGLSSKDLLDELHPRESAGKGGHSNHSVDPGFYGADRFPKLPGHDGPCIDPGFHVPDPFPNSPWRNGQRDIDPGFFYPPIEGPDKNNPFNPSNPGLVGQTFKERKDELEALEKERDKIRTHIEKHEKSGAFDLSDDKKKLEEMDGVLKKNRSDLLEDLVKERDGRKNPDSNTEPIQKELESIGALKKGASELGKNPGMEESVKAIEKQIENKEKALIEQLMEERGFLGGIFQPKPKPDPAIPGGGLLKPL